VTTSLVTKSVGNDGLSRVFCNEAWFPPRDPLFSFYVHPLPRWPSPPGCKPDFFPCYSFLSFYLVCCALFIISPSRFPPFETVLACIGKGASRQKRLSSRSPVDLFRFPFGFPPVALDHASRCFDLAHLIPLGLIQMDP